MAPLDYDALSETKNYLQDVAKIIGKVQQLFLMADSHDSQRGLEVVPAGLSSQGADFPDGQKFLVLDVVAGCLRVGSQQWLLGENTAQQLLNLVRQWLAVKGITKHIEQPEFVTHDQTYDATQAAKLMAALRWANGQLKNAKDKLPAQATTPLLIFPHHFDVAFNWLTDALYTLGFSAGDEIVGEAYFYVTADPEPTDFKQKTLPPLARWQQEGFSGAVMTFNSVINQPDAETLVDDFFNTFLNQA